MSLSVQCPVLESFKFNGKKVRSVHVKGEECLFSKDVYEAIGYDKENGIKAILRLVPEKYKMRLGNAEIHLKGVDKVENFLHPQADAVLLKEPDLYCFLLRCRKDKVEPLIE